jgi:CheY-like chemotaxis protein
MGLILGSSSSEGQLTTRSPLGVIGPDGLKVAHTLHVSCDLPLNALAAATLSLADFDPGSQQSQAPESSGEPAEGAAPSKRKPYEGAPRLFRWSSRGTDSAMRRVEPTSGYTGAYAIATDTAPGVSEASILSSALAAPLDDSSDFDCPADVQGYHEPPKAYTTRAFSASRPGPACSTAEAASHSSSPQVADGDLAEWLAPTPGARFIPKQASDGRWVLPYLTFRILNTGYGLGGKPMSELFAPYVSGADNNHTASPGRAESSSGSSQVPDCPSVPASRNTQFSRPAGPQQVAPDRSPPSLTPKTSNASASRESASTDTTTSQPGVSFASRVRSTGLGLGIAARLAMSMGATIRLYDTTLTTMEQVLGATGLEPDGATQIFAQGLKDKTLSWPSHLTVFELSVPLCPPSRLPRGDDPPLESDSSASAGKSESLASSHSGRMSLPQVLIRPASPAEPADGDATTDASDVQDTSSAPARRSRAEREQRRQARRKASSGTEPPSVDTAAATAAASSTEELSALAHKDSRPISSLRVLLVDDDNSVRDITARMLRRLGCQVDMLVDGYFVEQTLKQVGDISEPSESPRVASHTYDVVFLDIVMPRVPGDVVARRLVEHFKYPVPLIACSGNAMPADLARYRALGFSGVAAKPFSLQSLKDKLHQISEAIECKKSEKSFVRGAPVEPHVAASLGIGPAVSGFAEAELFGSASPHE